MHHVKIVCRGLPVPGFRPTQGGTRAPQAAAAPPYTCADSAAAPRHAIARQHPAPRWITGSSILNTLLILGNVLAILGRTVAVSPWPVNLGAEVLRIDLPLAAVVALVCLPVFRSDSKVSRRAGTLFVLAYLSYLGTLLAWRS